MSIIAVNLTHVYSPDTPWTTKALDQVNLEIQDGEVIGLIGHTGSGKSTLVQHFNGLLKPTAGTLHVQGIEVTKGVNLRPLRQKVGLVFQYPEHQLFEENVALDVAFGLKNIGLPREEIQQRVEQALSAVGIDYQRFKDRSPFELSGGQMRRVAIAGVLAMEPEVLILDEPTAGLDPHTRKDLLEHLRLVQKERGITLIIVSHSMDDIAAMVNRILVMDKGKIAAQGSPGEIFSQGEKLRRIGLDVPPLTQLILALRARGIDLPADILDLEEARAAIGRWLRGGKGNV
ncbi:MAG: energy-coupling factor transporter ATPase [Bacillota bacterium]|jgi:energy-coupling factor transport system ATP-binding protein|nr:energy-coupling factor transporter ATPase [Bacillota bacterium]HPZ22792.1 energy-coupling factor transporter ATPase [Bacillota bacterium]HQD20448.1 energy-coupling factor transporter ATPase [Bacillota bacterium]